MKVQTTLFSISALNLPILAYHFRPTPEDSTGSNNASPKSQAFPKVLILGGVHGDEIEGVIAAQKILEKMIIHYPYQLEMTIVPQFNIDGVLKRQRTNGNGVDLNRNLPTQDWSPEVATPRYHPGPSANSESENRALSRWIESHQPDFILSLHSWKPMLNVNGDCHAEAQIISELTGYRIDPDIGYPTPGSLGTYAGIERKSPTLTYEIERGLDFATILNIHVPAILEALKKTELRKRI